MTKKDSIVKEIHASLTQRKQALQTEMVAIQASANNETKSSAGDKYETARAMAQIEIDRLKNNLQVIDNQIIVLEKIKLVTATETASFGALVSTNRGVFLLGVGLGKITTSLGEIYAISLESPLGQQMKGQEMGGSFRLAANDCSIISIE